MADFCALQPRTSAEHLAGRPSSAAVEGNFRIHAFRRTEDSAYGFVNAGFRVQYPLQPGTQVHRRKGEWQGCLHQGKAEDRRHRGNHERKEPEAVTGLGELCGFRQSQEQDPTGIERIGVQDCGRRQGTSVQKAQELETGIP